jgi:N-acetyl-alpha-D-glucosaminyl L-malate synthase BshA
MERSGGVTAVSQYLKEETEKIFSPAKPIEVLYNFYTPRKPGRSGAEVRRELRIDENDVLAIHASNLRPVKRIPDLLHIAAGVESKRFKLLILSGNDFAPFEPLVDRLGIEKRVIVKEKVLDIDTYLSASDLGIYTSQDETFGMGILESMSHGMPVVASRVGGVPEVLEDEKSGILCPMGDVEAFVAAINRLVEDPALRASMGRQGKIRACSKFSAAIGVNEYVKYYRRVIEDCKG